MVTENENNKQGRYMKNLVKTVTIILISSVVGASIWGVWEVGRRINYNFSYNDMVLDTIKDNVKSECLIK